MWPLESDVNLFNSLDMFIPILNIKAVLGILKAMSLRNALSWIFWTNHFCLVLIAGVLMAWEGEKVDEKLSSSLTFLNGMVPRSNPCHRGPGTGSGYRWPVLALGIYKTSAITSTPLNSWGKRKKYVNFKLVFEKNNLISNLLSKKL